MSVVIRAALRLAPGAELYYDCPIMGNSFEGNSFFDQHRGKTATFESYGETLVGPLDHQGRLPGRYVNPEAIRVCFPGEEPRSLNCAHFVLRGLANAELVGLDGREAWLGDLEHPLCFYPGDKVRFLKKPHELVSDEPHEIVGAFFLGENKRSVPVGIPHYDVRETEEEYATRAATKIRYMLRPSKQCWHVVGEDLELVCFAEHRPRVRALTERLWRKAALSPAGYMPTKNNSPASAGLFLFLL